jgi:hypothetical protein
METPREKAATAAAITSLFFFTVSTRRTRPEMSPPALAARPPRSFEATARPLPPLALRLRLRLLCLLLGRRRLICLDRPAAATTPGWRLGTVIVRTPASKRPVGGGGQLEDLAEAGVRLGLPAASERWPRPAPSTSTLQSCLLKRFYKQDKRNACMCRVQPCITPAVSLYMTCMVPA